MLRKLELLRNAPEQPAPVPNQEETSSTTSASEATTELTLPEETTASAEGSELTLEETTEGEAEGAEKDEAEEPGLHGAPEGEYETFVLPDGMAADDQLMGEFTPLAKELNLSQKGAQRLVDMHLKSLNRQREVWAEHVSSLREQARKDPEIGGANYEANRRVAISAIKQFGDAELTSVLTQYGVGSHPAMIRFCHRIGKAMGEVGITSDAGAGGAQSNKPLHEILYKG